jgi:hypothetical protein
MDFCSIRATTRRDRFRCTRCTGLPNEQRRLYPLFNALALYLLAGFVIGLPLSFPADHHLWLWVNAGLSVAVGYLVAHTVGRTSRAFCPFCHCGWEQDAEPVLDERFASAPGVTSQHASHGSDPSNVAAPELLHPPSTSSGEQKRFELSRVLHLSPLSGPGISSVSQEVAIANLC